MKDANLIYRYERCVAAADELAMSLTHNGDMFLVQGTNKPKSFKGSFSTDSVLELHGFLAGILESKRVAKIRSEK